MKNSSPPACLQSERWDVQCSVAAALAVVTASMENKGHACRNLHGAATSNACYKIDPPFQICGIFISPWSWALRYGTSHIQDRQWWGTKAQSESENSVKKEVHDGISSLISSAIKFQHKEIVCNPSQV